MQRDARYNRAIDPDVEPDDHDGEDEDDENEDDDEDDEEDEDNGDGEKWYLSDTFVGQVEPNT